MGVPSTDIDGHHFEVSPLNGMDSFIMQPRLAPLITEVAVLVASALDSDEFKQLLGLGEGETIDLKKLSVEKFLDLDLNMGVLAEHLNTAVARICLKLPPKELRAITRELLANATMDGRRLFSDDGDPFNVLMRGKTLLVWRLLFFAVQINYPDVFSRRAANGGATQAKASPSEKSSTSPPSGPADGS